MKKNFIKLISAVLCLILLLSLAACSKDYRDDLKASELASAIEKAAPAEGGYAAAESDFADFNMKGITDICDEYVIKLSSADTDMSEFGVFHAKNPTDAKKISDICQKYLDKTLANYNPDYLPEEYPKIQNAKVTVYGNYVVYTMLTETERAEAVEAITTLIAN